MFHIRVGSQSVVYTVSLLPLSLDIVKEYDRSLFIHCEAKKTAPFYFCYKFVKPSYILIIFGTHIP